MNFQIMFLSDKGTVIDITLDFQKGESYLTNNKQSQVTKLVEIIPLQAIKTISLDFQGQVHIIRDCPVEAFDAFVSQYTEVEDVNRKLWSSFQRWRVINFLIDDGALEVQDNLLVEVNELEVERQPVAAQEGA